MISATFLFLSTSYIAWYLERFELDMIYLFDSAYSTPHDAGVPELEELRFRTSDGESLVLWTAGATPGKPTVLYLPGNAGTLQSRAERFRQMQAAGFGVVALSYRGSSGSSGKPDEERLTADAIEVVASLDAPLILFGESLGTAVAVKLAAQGFGDALLLEAAFTSVPALVASQYPDESLGHLLTQRWDSLSLMTQVDQPLMMIHGTHDKLVPIGMARAIYVAAQSEDKHFVEVDAGGHNNLWSAETQAQMFEFIDRFAQ